MTTHWKIVATALALMLAATAGCSSAPDDGLSEGSPSHLPAVPQPGPKPAPVPVAPPSAPAFKPVANDQCGAQALQYLIGKPRTEIPVPLDPGRRRVVCSTCVITQDYRSDRQTITFDVDTGVITSVKCG